MEGVTLSLGDQPVGSLGAFRLGGSLGQNAPDTGRITLEGLRVEPFPQIADWLQKLGYAALTGDLSAETRFDVAAGRLELVGLLLGLRDAAALGLSFTLEGLTPAAMEAREFQDARLAGFALRYQDQSLLRRLAQAEAGPSPAAGAADPRGLGQSGGGGASAAAARWRRCWRRCSGCCAARRQEVTITARPPKPVPVSELPAAGARWAGRGAAGAGDHRDGAVTPAAAGATAFAWCTARAVRLTMPRAVTLGTSTCIGLRMPSSMGPSCSPSAAAFSRLKLMLAASSLGKTSRLAVSVSGAVRHRPGADRRDQRGIGVHLAIHLQLRGAGADQRQRLAHLPGRGRVGGAEGGMRQQRHLRHDAEGLDLLGRQQGHLGDLLGGRLDAAGGCRRRTACTPETITADRA